MIAMPNADSHNARVLQEDNTDLVRTARPCPCPHRLSRMLLIARCVAAQAYEFARKFPG
jgi:hypothetical protein